jgi:hypothetical protein
VQRLMSTLREEQWAQAVLGTAEQPVSILPPDSSAHASQEQAEVISATSSLAQRKGGREDAQGYLGQQEDDKYTKTSTAWSGLTGATAYVVFVACSLCVSMTSSVF